MSPIDTSLEVTRIIKADRSRVFEAWTNSEMIKQWWGPNTVKCPEATFDLRVGGEISIANQNDDGSIVWIKGEVEAVDQPAKIVYSWNMISYTTSPTRVTVLFNEHPQGTELILTHERFENSEVRDNHLLGWGGCLDSLDTFLGA